MTHVWQIVNPGKCGGCEVCGELEQHYMCIDCGIITYDLDHHADIQVAS